MTVVQRCPACVHRCPAGVPRWSCTGFTLFGADWLHLSVGPTVYNGERLSVRTSRARPDLRPGALFLLSSVRIEQFCTAGNSVRRVYAMVNLSVPAPVPCSLRPDPSITYGLTIVVGGPSVYQGLYSRRCTKSVQSRRPGLGVRTVCAELPITYGRCTPSVVYEGRTARCTAGLYGVYGRVYGGSTAGVRSGNSVRRCTAGVYWSVYGRSVRQGVRYLGYTSVPYGTVYI